MKPLIIATTVFCCLSMGCAALSEKAKMEEYGRTMDSYEAAMRLSDFNATCQYLDPVIMDREDCLQRYENLRLVSYDVVGVNIAENKQEVTQSVDVEYYFLDRNVVKKIQFEQSWRYQADMQTWLLKTPPPHFQ
jgi:hypothetical protein